MFSGRNYRPAAASTPTFPEPGCSSDAVHSQLEARTLGLACETHGGDDRYPKGGGVEAIGLRALAEELAG